VVDAVSRAASLALLMASLMIALSQPIVNLVCGGGRFTPEDVRMTAVFFALYTLALFAWSAQAIYARAFYAAGITWPPMIASVVILFVAFPLYGIGYRMWGAAGVVLASDAGIVLQAITLGVLLHRRRMVSLAALDFVEMARCLLASVVAGGVAWLFAWGLRIAIHASPNAHLLHFMRWIDLAILIVGTMVWALIAKVILEKVGSALPRVTMQRLRLGSSGS
jgi:putative peptidoglycan lipid II flippase